jgi:hypothetical protein
LVPNVVTESEVFEPVLSCGFSRYLDFAIRVNCRKEEEERDKDIYSGSGSGGPFLFGLVGPGDYAKPENTRQKALTKTTPHGR